MLKLRWVIVAAAAVVVAAGARPAVAQTSRPTLSPEVLRQIEASQREKAARTPAERKIDSQLLNEMARRQGGPAAALLGVRMAPLAQDAAGRVIVDITTTAAAAPALRADVARRGGEVLSTGSTATGSPGAPGTAGPRSDLAARPSTLRASVSLDRLRDIAARPDVIFIQPRREPRTHRRTIGAPAHAPVQVLPGGATTDSFSPTNTGQGSKTSEGDATHLAYLARLLYGVDGTGIKIGVLSDGVNGLASSQSRGDLGPVTVLPGQAGLGGEGTAMLEIIHDLAPGAQLYFATAFGGITQFAQNIRDLRAAGCVYLAILKSDAAAPRYLHLNANRGRLAIATNGQVHGHAAAAQTIAVAATPVAAPRDTTVNPGPYPNPFTTANTVETFTSDGPRRMFVRADGTPYTPGNLLSTGGIVRQTPVITAADGVSITGFGFGNGPFYGTSAAWRAR